MFEEQRCGERVGENRDRNKRQETGMGVKRSHKREERRREGGGERATNLKKMLQLYVPKWSLGLTTQLGC